MSASRLVASALVLAACVAPNPPSVAPPDAGAPPSAPERAKIYQLVLRTFGNTRVANEWAGTIAENGCGKFADLDTAALAAIRELGTTHVWLTGVLRQASLTAYPDLQLPAADPDVVKGRAGSPFAITDYYDVSPDYALVPSQRREEFAALVERIHAAGMKVMIDLVPNHVARGYASTVFPDRDFGIGDDRSVFFHPDNAWFYLVEPPGQALALTAPEGWTVEGLDGRFPPEDGTAPERTPRATGNNDTQVRLGPDAWYETVKLNWGFDFTTGVLRAEPRPRTWVAFDRILEHWQEQGIDGFRADFAHWIPAVAWRWLITRARERHPGTFFVAEAYDNPDRAPGSTLPGLVDAGFDAVYDAPIYRETKGILQGEKWANDLDALQPGEAVREHVVRYAENHDERRAASPLAPPGGDSGFGSGQAGFVASALLYLSSNGPVLVHAGQELGEPGAGREGYGGEDGRTSIFDYWSVPTLRAFHLAGWKQDALGEPARSLRAKYVRLLDLLDEPALRPGAGYYGLSAANRVDEVFGDRGHWVTAFLRFAPGQVLLFAMNFDAARAWSPRVRIPSEALVRAGIDGAERYEFIPMFGDVAGDDVARSTLVDIGATLPVPALGAAGWVVQRKP